MKQQIRAPPSKLRRQIVSPTIKTKELSAYQGSGVIKETNQEQSTVLGEPEQDTLNRLSLSQSISMPKELISKYVYPVEPPSPTKRLCVPVQLDRLSSYRETNGRQSYLRDTNTPGQVYRASFNTDYSFDNRSMRITMQDPPVNPVKRMDEGSKSIQFALPPQKDPEQQQSKEEKKRSNRKQDNKMFKRMRSAQYQIRRPDGNQMKKNMNDPEYHRLDRNKVEKSEPNKKKKQNNTNHFQLQLAGLEYARQAQELLFQSNGFCNIPPTISQKPSQIQKGSRGLPQKRPLESKISSSTICTIKSRKFTSPPIKTSCLSPRKMTLKDYIDLNNLSTKKNEENASTVGFLTPQSSEGQLDLAPKYPSVSSPRQKKVSRPKEQIRDSIETTMIKDINEMQERLSSMLELIENSRSDANRKQATEDDLMNLFRVSRMMKQKILNQQKEILSLAQKCYDTPSSDHIT